MPLPIPGAASFTPQLLAHVLQHPSLAGWTVNPSIFSTILLVLMARKGGLVVEVDDHGIDQVVDVLRAMMESVFGLSIRHVSVGSSTQTGELPGNLFHPAADDQDYSKTHSQISHTTFNYNATSKTSSNRKGESKSNGMAHHGVYNNQPDFPDVLLVTGLENAPTTVQMKLCEYLTKRRVEIETTEEGQVEEEVHTVCQDFDPVVIWVRREGSEVPWWVTDHFMCGTCVGVSDIVLPPRDLAPGTVVPPLYISTLKLLLPYTYIHPPLAVHISNLFSAVTGHPSLHSTLTQRAVRAFPEYVRAHRLLVGGFDLPDDFELRLHQKHTGAELLTKSDQRGMGGGIGGVDSWNVLAGEEPGIRDLSRDAAAEGDVDVEDWYATPANVDGIWKVFMSHRVKRRQAREEVMWLMKDESAGSRSKHVDGRADRILDELIRTV